MCISPSIKAAQDPRAKYHTWELAWIDAQNIAEVAELDRRPRPAWSPASQTCDSHIDGISVQTRDKPTGLCDLSQMRPDVRFGSLADIAAS